MSKVYTKKSPEMKFQLLNLDNLICVQIFKFKKPTDSKNAKFVRHKIVSKKSVLNKNSHFFKNYFIFHLYM